MSMSYQLCPPEFWLHAADLLRRVGVEHARGSNSLESRAAAAVTTFIVDPGGCVLCVGRLSNGADSSPVRALKFSGFLDLVRVETRDRGHRAHRARGGLDRHQCRGARDADRRLQALGRNHGHAGVERRRMLAPSGCWSPKLVDDRRELVLLAISRSFSERQSRSARPPRSFCSRPGCRAAKPSGYRRT